METGRFSTKSSKSFASKSSHIINEGKESDIYSMDGDDKEDEISTRSSSRQAKVCSL